MNAYHQPGMVAVSIVVAILASYTALDLAGRVAAARGRARIAWLVSGAVALGTGIWAMHFVAMLAFHLPVPIAYDIPLVVWSLLAAFGASFLALFIASRRTLTAGSLCVVGRHLRDAAGMDGYISKPLSPKTLFDQIEALTLPAEAAAGDTVTNKDALLERFADHPELLGELAAIFLEDAPMRLAAIRTGVERRDAGGLESAAHALRGSAANFGATRAVDAALKLEVMGHGGDLTGADEAFADLQLLMEKLNLELGALTGAGSS